MSEGIISTHVLDTTRGEPAKGVTVTLLRIEGGKPLRLSSQETDADGRIARLNPDRLSPGRYQLAFELEAHFRRQGGAEEFFARLALDFTVTDPGRRYHIPLLLSPYSCASYRGS